MHGRGFTRSWQVLSLKTEDLLDRMIRLRPAIPSDREFLLRLRERGLKEDVLGVWGSWDANRQSQYVERILVLGDVAVVQSEERDIGMLTVEPRSSSLHIENVVLLPEYQGLGIGTALIASVCSKGTVLGIPITLEVLKSSRALSLYKNLGFTTTGETQTHFGMQFVDRAQSQEDAEVGAHR